MLIDERDRLKTDLQDPWNVSRNAEYVCINILVYTLPKFNMEPENGTLD